MTELHLIKHVARRYIAQRTYESGVPCGRALHNGCCWAVFEPARRTKWGQFRTVSITDFFESEKRLLVYARHHEEADTFSTVAMRYYMPFTRKAWMDDHLRSGA